MKRPGLSLLVVLGLLGLTSAATAQPPRAAVEKAHFEAFVERSAFAAGERARIVARVTIDEGWHIQAHEPSFEYLIPTELTVELPAGWPAASVEYPPAVLWQSTFEAEPLAVYEGETLLYAALDVPPASASDRYEIGLTLEYQACDERVCLPPVTTTAAVTLEVGSAGESQHQDLFAAREKGDQGTSAGRPPTPKRSLGAFAGMLLAGVIGGLILNAMPCVLPVLSLKVFALVKTAGQGRRQITAGALATALGILISFWALALTAIAVRAGGGLVGWGIQFQNPGFVAFLTVVLVFFCLNMWGLFEITLPAALGGALGSSGQGGGMAGHFSSGLLATLMATPCSAPFLGTAVGFALSQNAGTTLAVFTAVGVGMALPYLGLAVWPKTARLLPRPGAWMDLLKGAMGFLLAGTAVWLLYVLSAQVSPVRLAVLEVTLLSVGFFAWLRSKVANARLGSMIAAAGLVGAALATVTLAAGGTPPETRGTFGDRPGIQWQNFDRDRAEALAAAGELVFVDVTADWCATCKVNERLVLNADAIIELFERHGVVAMKADWTNRDDRIARYLEDFGRYAIPFYVLYRPGLPPHVFGELLTKGSVIAVVEASATGTVGPATVDTATG